MQPRQLAIGISKDDSLTSALAAAQAIVQKNLRNPALSPPWVAEQLQISQRALHHLFDHEPTTVGRYIRTLRVDAIAAELALLPAHATDFATLTAKYGFGSHDVAARAFKRQYGTTLTDYQRAIRAQQHLA